ncbi:MAG: hypothetical protein GF308_15990 [Candidatus Heimdallarchaeota archaeon]|nr:hypothetical protein [Candidatus Heimdallarchaeota archaeon]
MSINKTKNNKRSEPKRKNNPEIKEGNMCLLCNTMRLINERSDIAQWIASSNKPKDEIAKIATILSGIEFNEEMIDLLRDPSLFRIIFSS